MSEIDDLSFVVNDGVLSEPFNISRSVGSFELGGWQTSSTIIPGYGVASVATPEDLEIIPEADRVTGSMVFHSSQQIYLTQLDESTPSPTQRVSDIIIWNFDNWRVLHVSPYPNRGYWKAVAARMAGM